jgi:hypothetical protein
MILYAYVNSKKRDTLTLREAKATESICERNSQVRWDMTE